LPLTGGGHRAKLLPVLAMPSTQTAPAAPPPWLAAAASLGVGLALLACYWCTLAPSFTGRDGGELAAAVHVMGVAHPTGYPLYLVLGKLFDLLPLGEPARCLAFFSAVSAAGAGALLCWVAIALTGYPLAGVLAGLAAGLSSWVWGVANQAEVYALNLLLVVLALAAFVRWQAAPAPRRLYLLAAAAGLGLAHHRTSLFFTAPLLLWALWATRPRPLRLLAATTGWACLPLLLYLWLPVRSACHPPLNWGNTSGSWLWFWEHINGSLYLAFVLRTGAAAVISQVGAWGAALGRQLGLAGVLLIAIGLVGMLRSRHRPLGVLLLASTALYLLWAGSYRVADRQVFAIPVMIPLGLWCGLGLAHALAGLPRLKLSPALLRLVPLAGGLVALALPANLSLQHWARLDRSRDHRPLEQALLNLAGVPGDAVVLLEGDEPNAGAEYYYHALGRRPLPLLLPTEWAVYDWAYPLLPAWLRPALARAAPLPEREFMEWLPYYLREVLDPRRPLYTNLDAPRVPPGFVLLKDHALKRLVLPPGLPLAADRPRMRPVTELPQGSGWLLGVQVPPVLARGAPFPIRLAVRLQRPLPDGWDLQLLFLQGASPSPGGAVMVPRDQVFARRVPLLFGLALPATPPGRHYQQDLFGLPSRRLRPGAYQLYLQFCRGRHRTAPVPLAATVTLR